MRAFPQSLPIDDALPELCAALGERNAAVLVAPPGAGKTTRVPLALARRAVRRGQAHHSAGAAPLGRPRGAQRMASTLDEQVGETVGLRMRLQSPISARTRIEVVTEGVFARMILDDPELTGVGAVLFDEFHERSLDADLGLALALDAQGALREDLRLLVMSATLDGARVPALMDGAPRDHQRRPRLSRRDALCRPRSERADRRRDGARRAARARRGCRLGARVSSRAGRNLRLARAA